MQKNICKAIISSKEQNSNKQMAEFRISILFKLYTHFPWPNSILVQGLENQFNNSVLFNTSNTA